MLCDNSPFQYELMACKEKRSRLMSDLIGGIKTVKIYAWEIPMMEKVETLRHVEMDKIRNQVQNYRLFSESRRGGYVPRSSFSIQEVIEALIFSKLTQSEWTECKVVDRTQNGLVPQYLTRLFASCSPRHFGLCLWWYYLGVLPSLSPYQPLPATSFCTRKMCSTPREFSSRFFCSTSSNFLWLLCR